jgi:hypothetical protein
VLEGFHSMLKVLGLIPSTKTKQEFKLKVYWGEDRNLELPQNKVCLNMQVWERRNCRIEIK